MNTKDKQQDIRKKTLELIENTKNTMTRNLDRVLASGCIDTDSHDGNYKIPKDIVCALLQNEADQFYIKGCNDKDVDNIYKFI
ncbi:MAG: hypothetical protein II401_10900 [Bacteroidales bacterium]|nr:hypothetical protein [Bacteroidales bacterium]